MNKKEQTQDFFLGINKNIYPASFCCDDCIMYAIERDGKLFCKDLQTEVEFGKRHPECRLKIAGK